MYKKGSAVRQLQLSLNGSLFTSWLRFYPRSSSSLFLSFQADSTSLQDYSTFTWSSSCRRTGVEKNAVVMEEAIQVPGRYRLLYIGAKNCVLGASEFFEIG